MSVHKPILVCLAAGLIMTAIAVGGTYNLSWYTIDTGGGTSTNGALMLNGTIGQHDAGGPMTGGSYALTGGFWAGQSSVQPDTCPPDLNGDSQVNVADMLALLSDWGACSGCDGDLTGDGMVNTLDLLNLLSAWGNCP